MNKQKISFLFLVFALTGMLLAWKFRQPLSQPLPVPTPDASLPPVGFTYPLQIEQMRRQEYPGSALEVVDLLGETSTYQRFRVHYTSDGLKIFALLTVPKGTQPEGGWPAIVFNHGYIPPEEYRTNERYVAYVDGFARSGFVVIKPDYRGHGESEGQPEGTYFSPAYTTDVLNALGSLRQDSRVNPERIGMWGHSMGGNITLRAMVVSPHIKAGVIWGGAVGTYADLNEWWREGREWRPSPRERSAGRQRADEIIAAFGEPDFASEFWRSITPVAHLEQLSGPIQLHHGTADRTVPVFLSERTAEYIQQAGKTVQLYTYKDADHNLSGSAFSPAMNRSIEFFQEYL